MKKTAFIANFIAWAAVAIGTTAFLAWYHATDVEQQLAASSDASTMAQLGAILAAPVLLYAMGAVLGLLFVFFKKIEMGRTSRLVLRVASIFALVFILLAGVPVIEPTLLGTFELPLVIVVYVSRVAPILIMMFGFFYALGVAPTDTKRRGVFAKYLPDDHFE